MFIPSYKPKVIITKTTTPYKPPPYEPPYKSPLYKSQHKKLFDFGGFIPKRISIAGKRRKTLFDPSRWRIHPVEMEWDLVEDLL